MKLKAQENGRGGGDGMGNAMVHPVVRQEKKGTVSKFPLPLSLLAFATSVALGASNAQAALKVRDARVVYGQDAIDNQLRWRDQNFSSASADNVPSPWITDPSNQVTALDPTGSENGIIEWVISKISARTGRQVVALQYWRRGNATIRYFNLLAAPGVSGASSSWSQIAGFPFLLNAAGSEYQQFVDLVAQTRTGRFMVVYRDNANPRNLNYLQLKADLSAPVSSGTVLPGDGMPSQTMAFSAEWVKLCAHPFTDEVLLLAQESSSGKLYSWVWDPTLATPAWRLLQASGGNSIATLISSQHRRFEAAFEAKTGRALLVYSNGTTRNTPTSYRILRRTPDDSRLEVGWSNSEDLLPSSHPSTQHVSLASRAGSNQIAAGLWFTDGSGAVEGAVWDDRDDGSCVDRGAGPNAPAVNCFLDMGSVNRTTPIDTDVQNSNLGAGQSPVAVGWAGTTAVLVYPDKTSGTGNISIGLDWARWPNANPAVLGWQIVGDAFSGSAAIPNVFEGSFQIASYPGSNELIVAYSDKDKEFWTAMYGDTCPPSIRPPCWSMPDVINVQTTPLTGIGESLPVASATAPSDAVPFSIDVNAFAAPSVALSGGSLMIPAAAASAIRPAPDIILTEQGSVLLKDDFIELKLPPAPLTLDWVNDFSGLTYELSVNGGPFTASVAELDAPTYADNKTIRFHLKRNLNTKDAVKIKGLQWKGYTTAKALDAAADVLTLNVLPPAASTPIVSAKSTETIQIIESAKLDNAAVANAFLQVGTVINKELLKFTVTSTGGTVALTGLNFGTGFGGTMGWGNVTKLELWEAGSLIAGTTRNNPTDANFTGLSAAPFSVAAGAPRTYTLMGSFQNLTAGQSLSVSLLAGGVTANGTTSGVVGLPSSAISIGTGPISKTHTVSTYVVTTPASLTVADPWTITWQSYGDASPTSVTVEYSVDGKAPADPTKVWLNLPAPCTVTPIAGGGQCATTVPDNASTQAQVRVTDNTVAAITGSSALFNIGIQLSGLSPNGAETWIVGRNEQVRWTQTGSSTTTVVELALDGANYTVPIATQSVSTPTAAVRTATFQPAAAHATAQAKVRVRDGDAAHPAAVLTSAAVFTIDTAFKGIQPSSGTILVGQPTTISWITSPAFSSASIRITAIGPDPGGLPVAAVSNSGSFNWTPQNLATGTQLKICDATLTSVCATGQPFNVVQLSVATDKASYLLGETLQVSWTGFNTVANVRLLFKPSDGSPDIDMLGGTVLGASGSVGWFIDPTKLSVPKTGIVRVQDSGNSAIGADSAPVVLHGVLTLTAPAVADRWLVGSTQNIQWTGKGNSTVKLEWATAPAGAFSLISGASSVISTNGANVFSWTNVPVGARSPTAVIRITDVNDATAQSVSPAFHVIGQLQVTQPAAGANFDVATSVPISLGWNTLAGSMPQVRLRLLDSGNQPIVDAAFPAVVTNTGTFSWMPQTTWQNVYLEVCDSNDLTVCDGGIAKAFTVSGLKVLTPVSGDIFTLGATGISVPVTWKMVGGSGSVNLKYRLGAGALKPIAGGSAVGSPNNAEQTFNWAVPVNFADLSDQVQVVASDTGSGPSGGSGSFSIRGALAFTSPAGGSYMVNDPLTIAWSTIGQISAVSLGWSMDNCVTQTSIPAPANNANGSTSVSWTIPLSAVSNNVRFCLADAVAGHAVTTAMSAPIVVGARIDFGTSPAGGERWAVNEVHPVSWMVTGSVSQVLLEYATETDGYTTWKTVGTYPNRGSGGSINWQVPDVLPNPQVNPAVHMRLRISNPATPAIAPVVSPIFQAVYYVVTWDVLDSESASFLFGLSVSDISGWQVFDNSLVSTGTGLGDRRGTIHAYPAGTYTTTFNKLGYSDATLSGWTSDADKTLTIRMESATAAQMPWKVNASYEYEDATKTVHITTYLERREQLVNAALVQNASVAIYDGAGNVVATLTSATPDAAGVHHMNWDASAAQTNITYFGKASITYNGNPYTSGGTFNLLIPKTIQSLQSGTGGTGGITLNQLQTELGPLKTDVGAIKTIVTPLPGQISNAQSAIQNDIALARGDVAQARTDIAKVQATADSIKTDTTAIGGKIDGVKAYLEDPNAGLPKVLSSQTAMQDQLKAQRRGGILNRALEVEQGKNAVIRYRSVSDAVPPRISVRDPLGMSVAAGLPMAQVAANLYEYTLAGAALGEYKVTINEDASADSSGTLDGAVVTVSLPKATGQDVTSLTNQLTALSTQLTNVEANLNGKLDAINAAMATKAQVDGVVTKADQLLAKWGAATADELKTSLGDIYTAVGLTAKSVDGLNRKLGAPKTGSLAGDIAAIPGATDYSAQFTALQDNLTALKTAVNDPAQSAKLQEVMDAVTAVKTQIAALPTTPNNSQAVTDALNTLNAAVIALKTDVAALPKTDQTATLNSLQASLASVNNSVAALPTVASAPATSTGSLETAALLAKLDQLQREVQSAQGSSAAVGLSQAAYSSAAEALKILQQIQANLQQNGGAGYAQVPVLLGKFGDQMKQVSQNINALPGKLSEDEEVLAQIKKLTKQAQGIASDKGYHFDALYEMSEEQKGDVRTMRNQVEELKALVEMQRALLEKNMNQPVIKTWFETR